MVCCWAVGCSNRSEGGKFKFHAFPKDADRLRLWAQKVNRLDTNSNPRKRKLLQPAPGNKLCEVAFL